MSSSYAKALGARLRSIRQQQDLSLSAVEAKSNGKWKAVVVGSYERGDRAITVAKLAELADFYGVPLGELVPEGSGRSGGSDNDKVRFDLQAVHALSAEKGRLLSRYLAAIQAQRGDYNGHVLTVRASDIQTLAVLYDEQADVLLDRFVSWGVVQIPGDGEAAGTR